jgi:hypothetical protein
MEISCSGMTMLVRIDKSILSTEICLIEKMAD